ncbi:MAG: 3-deoxy-7-phosphoheptulonate synthase [Clostridia bacterium]|nr:3-deoxy-7-phosphoheptulonate synthase [Clostridia bacterium]
MIIVMKPEASQDQINSIAYKIEQKGLAAQIMKGEQNTVIGVAGDASKLDRESLALSDGIEEIVPIKEPFKRANIKIHPEPTVINVKNAQIGGKKLCIMAGPCSIESDEQVTGIAKSVKAAGASMLRGGAYKPRTSPYSFQGLKGEGLMMMVRAGQEANLPIVTEILDPRHVEMFENMVDVMQIGARNVQNFELLKEVGRCKTPVLLKRGFASTIDEWLMSAEYIMSEGNENVILCERGIRTFSKYTRNTLDLSAVPVIKRLSHLPIIVDPSHALGKSEMVECMSLAAIAAGADGLLVEVHNDPKHALCDGAQSITPDQFKSMMEKIKKLAPIVDREL